MLTDSTIEQKQVLHVADLVNDEMVCRPISVKCDDVLIGLEGHRVRLKNFC